MDFYRSIKSFNIQKWSSRHFSILGGTIARHPLYFLAVPMIISAVLSTGILWMKINRDPDSLYVDLNGEAVENKRLVESLFPINTSIYSDILRVTSVSDLTMVLLIAKDKGSMLREHVMEEVLEMHNIVRNIEVEWRGSMLNYSVLCGRKMGACNGEGLLEEIVSNFRDIRDGRYKIKYPIDIDNLTYTYKEYVSVLAKVELDEGFVKDITSMTSVYLMDYSDGSKLEAIAKWDLAVINYLNNKAFKYIDVTSLSRQSTRVSSEALMFDILKIMPIVVGTLVLFSALTCVTDDWTTSKPVLGLAACLSAVLAIVSGFGLAFIVGIEYTDCYLVVAYAVLVLEVDDAFVLISSWRNTNPNHTVSKRMEQTYNDTAPSITVTSLTNVLSCSIGIATSVPGFRSLCSIAFFCSFFAYVYQITFFGACLALSGYIEEGRTPFAFCSKKKNTEIESDTSPKIKKGDIFMLHFRNTLGHLLSYRSTKIIVVFTFVANLAISSWGWTYLKYGIGMGDLFPAESSVTKFVEMKYKYSNDYLLPVHVIVKDTVNYADSQVQNSIETLLKRLESHPNVDDSSLRVSWLTYYKKFIQHPVGKFLFRGFNMTDKQDFIDGLRYIFLNNILATQFNYDIVFNENNTEIVASRFLLLMKNINSSESEISAIREIQKIVSESEIPVKIFGFSFHMLEQAWMIKTMAVQIACPAVCLICLVFLVFSQNIRSSMCVSFVVLCVICEMAGYCCLWGVRLDLATLNVFIASIGFSINYTAHMAFAFVTETNVESGEKIKNVIYRVGFSLIQGALSTILSLFILVFQPLYILVATFKILCLIALLTTVHALFVIPVLLHLTGSFSQPVSGPFVDGSSTPLFRYKNKQTENK